VSNTFVGVLKYKNFSKLWVSQITSQVALHMLNFALVLHIYELTHSNASISLVLIASAIPSVIFGSFSGVMADRLKFKNILTYTNFLRFLAVLLLFVAKDNVLAVLEIIFIISSITQFFAPAEMSSIPVIVPKEKLVSANSLTMTTMYITLIVGYSIAGPLLNVLTANGLFLLCCLLYLIATWSTNSMSNYDKKEVQKISISTLAKDLENIWREMTVGIKSIRANRKVIDPIFKLAFGWMVLGAFIVLMPSFGEKVLHINPRYIGPAIIGPAGFGMLIGSYLVDKFKKLDLKKITKFSIMLIGIALLLISFYKIYQDLSWSRPLNVFFIIMLGIGCSGVYISAQTLIHLNSGSDERGKVFGLSTMLTNLALSIPTLFVGGLADLTSPFVAMLILSCLIILYGVYQFQRSRPKIELVAA